jgi:hypothetical protein
VCDRLARGDSRCPVAASVEVSLLLLTAHPLHACCQSLCLQHSRQPGSSTRQHRVAAAGRVAPHHCRRRPSPSNFLLCPSWRRPPSVCWMTMRVQPAQSCRQPARSTTASPSTCRHPSCMTQPSLRRNALEQPPTSHCTSPRCGAQVVWHCLLCPRTAPKLVSCRQAHEALTPGLLTEQAASCLSLHASSLAFSSITASLLVGTWLSAKGGQQDGSGVGSPVCLCGAGPSCLTPQCGRLFKARPGEKAASRQQPVQRRAVSVSTLPPLSRALP